MSRAQQRIGDTLVLAMKDALADERLRNAHLEAASAVIPLADATGAASGGVPIVMDFAPGAKIASQLDH